MIRQAHGYLTGAISGTALIGAAVVTFVLLVSLQALRDWPLAGIQVGGGGGEPAAGSRSTGREAGPGGLGRGRTEAGRGGRATARTVGGSRRAVEIDAGSGPAAGAPAAAPGGGGGSPGSTFSPGQSAPSAGNSGSAAPGPSGTGEGSSGSTSNSTSGAVTGAVDETAKGVDEATGGALGATGVTEATEGVVDGVAGPESTVGKTVDKTAEAVGGPLDGGSH